MEDVVIKIPGHIVQQAVALEGKIPWDKIKSMGRMFVSADTIKGVDVVRQIFEEIVRQART